MNTSVLLWFPISALPLAAASARQDQVDRSPRVRTVSQVINGGFEEGPADQPTGWLLVGSQGKGPWQSRCVAAAFSGKRALRLETVPAPLKNPPPGTRLVVRLDTLLSPPKGGVKFRYRILTGPAENFFVAALGATNPGVTTSQLGPGFRAARSDAGDGRWHEGSFAYDRSVDPFAKGTQLYIGLGRSGGVVLVDDVEVTAPPPTPEGER